MGWDGHNSVRDRQISEAVQAIIRIANTPQTKDQRRYETASRVLAAMVGANTSTIDDGTTTWPDSNKDDVVGYSAIAVTAADALLAALEADRG